MTNLYTLHGKADRRIIEMIVFPIVKALFLSDGSELHKIIGTGFFLNSDGLFVTARNVFRGRQSALDTEGATGYAVYCVHSVNLNRKFVTRHIDVASIKSRDDTDIAVGWVEPNQFGRSNPEITAEELRQTAFFSSCKTDELAVGTKIYTLAYPLAKVSQPSTGHVHFDLRSDVFRGSITRHYKDGRDSGLLPWPCYETDMEIKAGASGGPVFVSGGDGSVVAVNCSGTTPHTVSHVTSLAPLID